MTPLPQPKSKTKEQQNQEARDYYKHLPREKLIDHLVAYANTIHHLAGRVQFLYVTSERKIK